MLQKGQYVIPHDSPLQLITYLQQVQHGFITPILIEASVDQLVCETMPPKKSKKDDAPKKTKDSEKKSGDKEKAPAKQKKQRKSKKSYVKYL